MNLNTRTTLSKSMTLAEFENGYWYATGLKEFATIIGLPSAHKLRKDELEKAIQGFLKAGKIKSPTTRSLTPSSGRDAEQGLALNLAVASYRNDRATWDFIEREGEKLV